MRKRLFVIDGFYPDPYSIRTRALESAFTYTGNYPGRRTAPTVEAWVRSSFENILCEPITYWPVERDNGAFQITCFGQETAVHADPGWVGLIYLTPNPLRDGGTLFYKHVGTNFVDAPADNTIRIACEREGSDWSKWQLIHRVDNVFNRLVLFEGRQWHSAGKFFGDNRENGRLFQTFFFWLAGSADWI